jgi:DNA-binding transcriptional regulator LsrR (DeoR family)
MIGAGLDEIRKNHMRQLLRSRVLFAEGMSKAEIGRTLGISARHVARLLEEKTDERGK